MLKPIITIIFLLSVALQTFSTALIVVDYFSNTTSYARNCENKANLHLHCNGKCQMMKKLQHEQQKDQQSPERKGDNKNETILYLQTSFASVIPTVQDQSTACHTRTCDGRILKMPRAFFHPPGA